jgi:hypothetical protein
MPQAFAAHRANLFRTNPEMLIRSADASDLPAIEPIVRDAYAKYITRIGKPPGPMLDDYRARGCWSRRA